MPDSTHDQIVTAMGRSVLLGVLPESTRADLARRARRKTYGPTETVFRRDDEGSGLLVLLRGRVKIVSFSAQGSEVILNVINEGEVFGEMSLIDGAPRCADAIAGSKCEIVVLDRRDFLAALDQHPEASRRLMGILCDRIRQTTSFVESAVFHAAPARLFLRLRALADQYGVEDGGVLRIEHGFSQQELGDSVGITRVSVNKHFTDWRREGLVSYKQNVIEIHDMDALEARSMEAD